MVRDVQPLSTVCAGVGGLLPLSEGAGAGSLRGMSNVVTLHARHFGGEGLPPLVILHGLLGSSRNWQTVARDLTTRHSVWALDLRNHGASPWADTMTYPEIAGDVVAWLDAKGFDRVHLLGHSMGGKTAMRLATDHPERLLSLTIVDIAPRDYEHHHRTEFAAMAALDPGAVTDRKEADAALAAGVPDWPMRQFLLTNLSRRDDGRFAWDINLPVLTAALPVLSATPMAAHEAYAGRTTFIVGGKSSFVRPHDREAILRHFPAAVVCDLPESGHNPHIEDRANFVSALAAAQG